MTTTTTLAVRPHASRERRTTRWVLRSSIAEGIVSGVFVGLGEGYLTAFALAAGASAFVISLLASLPIFLGAGAQLAQGPIVRAFGSRRRVVTTCAGLQGVAIAALAVLGVTQPPGLTWMLVTLVGLYTVSGALIVPTWSGVIAEVVPSRFRGRYFSRRSQLAMVATVASSLTGGFFLSWTEEHALWGFAAMFLVAAVMRSASWSLLQRLPNDAATGKSAATSPAIPNVGVLSGTLRRFLIFAFLMNLAASMAGPYFAFYQLNDLKLSYVWFSVLQGAASVATFLTVTRWGRIADRLGNRFVIVASSLLVPVLPLLWLPFSPFAYLLAQLLSGVAWAGYNLCTTNYLLDATSRENRVSYLAYWSAGMRVSSALGALIGGFLLAHLPPLFGHTALSLFVLSAAARAVVAAGLVRGLPEVRPVGRLPLRHQMGVVAQTLRPDRLPTLRAAYYAGLAHKALFRRAVARRTSSIANQPENREA